MVCSRVHLKEHQDRGIRQLGREVFKGWCAHVSISRTIGPFSRAYFLAKAVAALTASTSMPSTHRPASTLGIKILGYNTVDPQTCKYAWGFGLTEVPYS